MKKKQRKKQKMLNQKRKNNSILVLLIFILIFIPLSLFIGTKNINMADIRKFAESAISKSVFISKIFKTNSLKSKNINSYEPYDSGTSGDYTWGAIDQLYDDWSLPFRVTEAQYGTESFKVGYCCYIGWPTVKGAKGTLIKDEIFEGGSADQLWTEKLALGNHNGHLQRVECTKVGDYKNLSKALAYALSGINGRGANSDRQNLVWNSWIWTSYGADSIVEGTLSTATKIGTTAGSVSLHSPAHAPNTAGFLERAQSFATFAYQILGSNDTINLKYSPEKKLEKETDDTKELHVEVDQSTNSYLIGPYQIDLTNDSGNVITSNASANGQSSQTLGDLLYKEVTKQNYSQSTSNSWAKAYFKFNVKYRDGTSETLLTKTDGDGFIIKQSDSSPRIVLTDENGVALAYGFPEFGKTFYVKFYQSDLTKTAEYFQPELSFNFLDPSTMSASCTKEQSSKLSYSVHYSAIDKKNNAVRKYIQAEGYTEIDLGRTQDNSLYNEAFFYSLDQSKRANIQDGIDAITNMVKESNQSKYIDNVKVTWYDNKDGWDMQAEHYGDRNDRCDGVIIKDASVTIDFSGGHGIFSGASEDYDFVFESEYDTVGEFWNILSQNYYLGLNIQYSTQNSYCNWTHEKVNDSFFDKYKKDIDESEISDDAFEDYCDCNDSESCQLGGSCDCGCRHCMDGGCSSCTDENGVDDCDCDCDCETKWRYKSTEVKVLGASYWRDRRAGCTIGERVKYIPGEELDSEITIPKQGGFDTKEEARKALAAKIKDICIQQINKATEKCKTWYYDNAYPCIYMPMGAELEPTTMPFVEEWNHGIQKVVYNLQFQGSLTWKQQNYITIEGNDEKLKLTKKEINEYLGGNVSETKPGIKGDGQTNGVWQGTGIEVTLLDMGPAINGYGGPNTYKAIATTLTDENGNYGFQKLNPLHHYKVEYKYDGLHYFTGDGGTDSISDHAINRNTATELKRDELNNRFEQIDASNKNYNSSERGPSKTYGWYTKLRKDDGSFIPYENKIEKMGIEVYEGSLRFCDAFELFKEEALKLRKDFDQTNINSMVDTYDILDSTKGITYDDVLNALRNTLTSLGVGTNVNEQLSEFDGLDNYNEVECVIQFIKDTFITARTNEGKAYPDIGTTKFFLEDVGVGDNKDNNNKTAEFPNVDSHSNYSHNVADNPFPALQGTGIRKVESLYNNNQSASTDGTIADKDQARNVDYIIKQRPAADIAIVMDIKQVTLVCNGQQETYEYSDLFNSVSDPLERVKSLSKIKYRQESSLYNYDKSYSRVITESEFLYNGDILGDGNDARNLSMYVTYQIDVANTGNVDIDIEQIVDHYDSYYLQWKKEDQDKIKQIVGEENCTASVKIPDERSYQYPADKTQLGTSSIQNMYNEVFIDGIGNLEPNAVWSRTITFEQTKDPDTQRLKLTQDLEDGYILSGDKNIVEIDGFNTNANDKLSKGLLPLNSNVGNLCPVDFYNSGNKNGGLIDDVEDPAKNRLEPDTCSAPDLVVYVPQEGYLPTISGYTFEDARNETSDDSLIGNGHYNTSDKDSKNSDNDKKINGITVELVELVREIDTTTGLVKEPNNYTEERIWGTATYTLEDKGPDARRLIDKNFFTPSNATSENQTRYYSGTDKAKTILDVDRGYLHIDENKKDEDGNSYLKLNTNQGEYKFVNVPPGEFVVRFIYGDTSQTVLTKEAVVNNLISGKEDSSDNTIDTREYLNNQYNENYMFLSGSSDGLISNTGLNDKSYNGNDFKSTVYQDNIKTQNIEIDQNSVSEYESIKGFTDTEKQNFTDSTGILMSKIGKDNNGDVRSRLYLYDIEKTDSVDSSISDAKDIYAFRTNSDNYAKGYISTTNSLSAAHNLAQQTAKSSNGELSNPVTLRNYRNEVLNSFEQVGTYSNTNNAASSPSVTGNFSSSQADMQADMLKELMKNTRMVAQSGVIRMDIEYKTKTWKSDGDTGYVPKEALGKKPEDAQVPSDAYWQKNGNYTDSKGTHKNYHIKNLNLGLTERPEAQLKLTKEVSNLKIVLSNGETLFDANKSVNNLYFAKHKEHTYKYNNKIRLDSVKVSNNSKQAPELIQGYMDDELLSGATLVITFKFKVENVGEVDYLDKQFYYTGKTNSTDKSNIARTNADEVIDYVSKNSKFDSTQMSQIDDIKVDTSSSSPALKDEKASWNVKNLVPFNTNNSTASPIADEESKYQDYIYPFGVSQNDAAKQKDGSTNANAYLVNESPSNNRNADLVNREYFDRLYTYAENGGLITTDKLSTKKYQSGFESSQKLDDNNSAITYGLLPKACSSASASETSIVTPLELSSILSQNGSLVFPNLAEIVRISNSVGRRTTYSTVGNQPMANQNYDDSIESKEYDKPYQKYSTYNPVDVVTPIEIDADSSQSVRILPPTGLNKNNILLFMSLIGGFAIIIVSIMIIRSTILINKKKRISNIKRWEGNGKKK